jgi:hypothetical protein
VCVLVSNDCHRIHGQCGTIDLSRRQVTSPSVDGIGELVRRKTDEFDEDMGRENQRLVHRIINCKQGNRLLEQAQIFSTWLIVILKVRAGALVAEDVVVVIIMLWSIIWRIYCVCWLVRIYPFQ